MRKKTGVDWPELQVGEIEKAMSSVTLFYWGTKEEVGKRWHQKQLELTDEEADSIGEGGSTPTDLRPSPANRTIPQEVPNVSIHDKGPEPSRLKAPTP